MIKVTTLITTYNHEKYIEQAIESALAQKGDFEHEIIILDDCSTDKTFEIVSKYAAENLNIKAISHKENIGISGNMKFGFEMAQGKYLAVLEGDDYWTDEYKLEKQIKFLEENSDCSMVFSKVKFYNQETSKVFFYHGQEHYKTKMQPKDWLSVQTDSIGCIFNFSCCLFITNNLKKLPLSLYEDHITEIGLVFYLATLGNIGFISIPLSIYRLHEGGYWVGASTQDKLKQLILCAKQSLSVCEEQYKQLLICSLKKYQKELFIEKYIVCQILSKILRTLKFCYITR